jgi:hypothetical protein
MAGGKLRNVLTIERCQGWIYEKGMKIWSKAIESCLGPLSWVPTRVHRKNRCWDSHLLFFLQNAFSEKLAQFGVNFYDMFVPDLLHEFELGVLKATFIHLLRILIAAGGDCIQQLNERFRQVLTFGRDTIQRFAKNTADLKKPAACDFENILQCCISVFEGLLDKPYNTFVLDLLWDQATWHALAKLRMHTTSTIAFLEETTTSLGRNL